MANEDIRNEVKSANLKLWQVSDLLGIRDTEFSKKLRKELSEEEKNKIRQAIKTI